MKKILIISSIIILLLVAARFVNVKYGEHSRAKALAAASVPTVSLDEVKEMEIYK